MIKDVVGKKLTGWSGVMGLTAGLLYLIANHTSLYQYRTDVSLGEFAADNNFQTFEPIGVTESFIRETLLLSPPSEELKKFGVIDVRSNALVTTIEAGRAVRVVSTAAEDDLELVKAVHRFIADGTIDHLKRLVDYVKLRLVSRRSAAEQALKVASDNLVLFSQLGSDGKLSESKTRELTQRLSDELSKLRQAEAPVSASDGDDPLRNGGGMNLRGQFAFTQRLGLVDLPVLRADMAKAMANFSQTAAQAQQAIKDTSDQLEAFREPTVTVFAQRSLSPVRPSLLMPLLVALVAALVAYGVATVIRRRRPA